MANPIRRLPTSEPIESKLVNILWLNDNIVAAPVSRKWQNVAPPAKGMYQIATQNNTMEHLTSTRQIYIQYIICAYVVMCYDTVHVS